MALKFKALKLPLKQARLWVCCREMAPEMKSSGWSGIRKQIGGWDKTALLGLVKDLHDASSANREFLAARFAAKTGKGAALETYREKIVHQFFPKRGFGKLKLAEARAAIRDYRKASGDMAGVLELLVTYVESAADFTCEYGDIDERFYNSADSVLEELTELLLGEGAEFYPTFRKRLIEVREKTTDIGWGYGDFVSEQVGLLEEKLGAAAKP